MRGKDMAYDMTSVDTQKCPKEALSIMNKL
jgi:hypothetical protein